MTLFTWTKRRERAARLVAEDELSDIKIAEAVGVYVRSLERWKTHAEFRARVAEYLAEIRAAILAEGIAVRENRVKALNERWDKMHQVITERAEDPELQDIAGGKTGLLVHNVKGVGKGEDFQLIDLYEVDTGLLKELREHEKQSAQEVGQWAEKREVTGKDGEALTVKHTLDLASLNDEELNLLERLIGKSAQPGRGPGRAEASESS